MGETVRLIVEEKGGDKVVVIPQSATAIDQTGSYVFVVGQNDKVEQRRVYIGVRDGLAVVVYARFYGGRTGASQTAAMPALVSPASWPI
jgi:multidrug efflux pump subunit AcrA (membrane-fusion protein)